MDVLDFPWAVYEERADFTCTDFAGCQSKDEVFSLLSAIDPVEIVEDNDAGMMLRAGGRTFEVIKPTQTA